jgi:hypothetical protein
MIAANFLRCQIAAERRIPTRIRFWRTIPVPVSIHW